MHISNKVVVVLLIGVHVISVEKTPVPLQVLCQSLVHVGLCAGGERRLRERVVEKERWWERGWWEREGGGRKKQARRP